MQGQGDDSLGIVASEEPPYNDAMPGSITFGTQRIPLVAARREFSFRSADGQQVLPDISEEEFWRQQRSRDLAMSARERRAQDRAAGPERAVRPRTQSHLETLAGMLSSEDGLGERAARRRARMMDETEGLMPFPLDASGASQSAAGAPDRDTAQQAEQAQQPGLRALEHRSTAFLQDLRQLTHMLHGPPPLDAASLHGAHASAFLAPWFCPLRTTRMSGSAEAISCAGCWRSGQEAAAWRLHQPGLACTGTGHALPQPFVHGVQG